MQETARTESHQARDNARRHLSQVAGYLQLLALRPENMQEAGLPWGSHRPSMISNRLEVNADHTAGEDLDHLKLDRKDNMIRIVDFRIDKTSISYGHSILVFDRKPMVFQKW